MTGAQQGVLQLAQDLQSNPFFQCWPGNRRGQVNVDHEAGFSRFWGHWSTRELYSWFNRTFGVTRKQLRTFNA